MEWKLWTLMQQQCPAPHGPDMDPHMGIMTTLKLEHTHIVIMNSQHISCSELLVNYRLTITFIVRHPQQSSCEYYLPHGLTHQQKEGLLGPISKTLQGVSGCNADFPQACVHQNWKSGGVGGSHLVPMYDLDMSIECIVLHMSRFGVEVGVRRWLAW